ncbi:MAG: hypothetical protein V1824_01475, partial [archaeon]
MKTTTNQKGVAEIISYIFIIIIVGVVVGITIQVIIPVIQSYQSQAKFKESNKIIDNIYNKIIELKNQPIGSSEELRLNLENLYLNIYSETDKIEIYHITNEEYFENKLKIDDGLKYTFRDAQKLYIGLEFNDIDINSNLSSQNRITNLHFIKTDKNVIKITEGLITED